MALRAVEDLVEAPRGGHHHEVLRGLARRLRLPALERNHDRRSVVGAFALVNGVVSIALMAAAAWATGAALVFPSLGPTAFLLFYDPLGRASSPRNTVCGHLLGVLAGYGALAAFGLTAAGPAVATGVTPARIGAAAVSLGVTAGAMVWLSVPHPPAGATTLIVSLGILHTPAQLGVLLLGVVLITAQGLAINRLAGLDYPVWAPRAPEGQATTSA
jgi:CBS-domain-containing membrane protein